MKLVRFKLGAIGLISALTLGSFAAAPLARADAPTEERAKRYRKSVPHQSIEAGCARIAVNAPLETVRGVVNDFDHYANFIKRYKNGRVQLQVTAKVVGRVGDKRDVYLEVPILKGAAKVWGVLRFDPMKTVGEEHILEGRLIKGNVERLDARWRLRKVDEAKTALDVELLIVPKVPVPSEVVTDELEFVSDVSVSGARNEAERRRADR